MKKICLLIAVAVGLLFIVVQSSTTIAAEPFKPMTLKFAEPIPEKSFYGQHHQWWANELEKRTGGKIKVQIFWMESLVKWKDMLQGVQTGIADLGFIGPTYHPSNLPLLMTLDFPFNYHQDYMAALSAITETGEKEPNLKAEMEREKIILVVPHITGHIQIGAKRNFDSVKDLKGRTIRTAGGARTKYYEYLGLNPIFMAYTDVYEAIERGTIGASEMAIVSSTIFKHYEVIKCVYMQNSGGLISSGIFLNREVFNKLPGDIQKIFIDLRDDYSARFAGDALSFENNAYLEWKTKHGATLKDPSPEDQRVFSEAATKAQEDMLKKQEAEGHKTVRNVFNYYKNALKKYGDQGAKKK